jgi:hypothetical protein
VKYFVILLYLLSSPFIIIIITITDWYCYYYHCTYSPCGAAAQRWTWPPHSWSFSITYLLSFLVYFNIPFTAETLSRSRTTLFGTCGERSDVVIDYSAGTPFSPCQYHSASAAYPLFLYLPLTPLHI